MRKRLEMVQEAQDLFERSGQLRRQAEGCAWKLAAQAERVERLRHEAEAPSLGERICTDWMNE